MKILLAALALIIVTASCTKHNVKKMSFQEYSWSLKSLSVGTFGEVKGYADKYTLVFVSDSTFEIRTDVRTSLGKYSVSKKNEISIIQCEDVSNYNGLIQFDALCSIAYILNNLNYYKLRKDEFTFNGDHGELVFVK